MLNTYRFLSNGKSVEMPSDALMDEDLEERSRRAINTKKETAFVVSTAVTFRRRFTAYTLLYVGINEASLLRPAGDSLTQGHPPPR